jgi:hypothetical protein
MQALCVTVNSKVVGLIDILLNLDGEYCQVKYSMFGEKENKKLKALSPIL